MMDTSQYLNVKQLAAKTGINARTLDRRLLEGVVPVYTDPKNRRRRLVHIDDVAKLTEVKQLR